jgi:hypothetical protein
MNNMGGAHDFAVDKAVGAFVQKSPPKPMRSPEASMHKLVVLYNEPFDFTQFRKCYVETYLPLASEIPASREAAIHSM